MQNPGTLAKLSLFKRTLVLLLACVLSLAGSMQQRVTEASLGNEGKAPVQRIYEEIEHARVQDIRSVEQRMGLKPYEFRPLPARVVLHLEAPRASLVQRPAAPRAPPHCPRAPPFVA